MDRVSKSPIIAGSSNSNAVSHTIGNFVVLGIAHTFTPRKKTPLKIAYFDDYLSCGIPDCNFYTVVNPNPKTDLTSTSDPSCSPDRRLKRLEVE